MAGVCGGRIAFGAQSAEVNLDYVAQRALERARHLFHSPRANLPKVLRPENLNSLCEFNSNEASHACGRKGNLGVAIRPAVGLTNAGI